MKNSQTIRAAVDFAAPVAFGLAFLVTRNFEKATVVLVAASVIALLTGWLVEKRVAFLPLIAGGAAVVFGGLTLVFHDPSFVKMKLTFVNLLFAALCVVVALFKPEWVKAVLGDAVQLPDRAIRTLMLRYAAFFVVVALANEYVWRTQDNGFWVGFRVALLPLALVFSLTQVPFMLRHMTNKPADPSDAAPTPPEEGF